MLNHDDIGLLMEGLDSIEKAHQASEAMGDIMGSLLTGITSKDNPEAMGKFEREREQRKVKAAADRRRKQEDVYLLRAKLVSIRRELDCDVAARIVDEAQRQS